MFTWDLQKAIINFEKHGVSFEEATTVFADSRALDWVDPAHSEKDLRHKILGASLADRILIVIHTIRSMPDGSKTIRIISARQASRKERKAYTG